MDRIEARWVDAFVRVLWLRVLEEGRLVELPA